MWWFKLPLALLNYPLSLHLQNDCSLFINVELKISCFQDQDTTVDDIEEKIHVISKCKKHMRVTSSPSLSAAWCEAWICSKIIKRTYTNIFFFFSPALFHSESAFFVLIYNCGILRNVQRDVFHILTQKSMPILIFSKSSIRYVSGCLERFVSHTHELCIRGQQITFPVWFKRCRLEEDFCYTAPSSEVVIARVFCVEDVVQHLLCPIMLNSLLE